MCRGRHEFEIGNRSCSYANVLFINNAICDFMFMLYATKADMIEHICIYKKYCQPFFKDNACN